MTETVASFVWKYAIGCLDARQQDGTISEKDYKIAQGYVDAGKVPPDDFVRRCFPEPFKHAHTLEEMRSYWREQHSGPDQHTPVYRAKIYKKHSILGEKVGRAWRVAIEDPPVDVHPSLLAVNWHNYDVRVGSVVFVHQNTIAELIEY